MSDTQKIDWQLQIFRDAIGFHPTKESVILDFGCGSGGQVAEWRQLGYQIFGCDVDFPDQPDDNLTGYLDSGVIRRTDGDPYQIPFEDNMFDVVFSNQVFEHIIDYPAVLREIRRILKPGGYGVHVFPGRFKRKESHVYVPYASVIRFYWWLWLWALTGIRNEFQQGKSAAETARLNYDYLRRSTNYLTRRQILKHVRRFFTESGFAEQAYFGQYPKHIRSHRFLHRLYRNYYSDCNMRVLIFRKSED